MARSVKRNPITGNCGGRDTYWRRRCAKLTRLRSKAVLAQGGEDAIYPKPQEIDSEWWWPRDGRRRWTSGNWSADLDPRALHKLWGK